MEKKSWWNDETGRKCFNISMFRMCGWCGCWRLVHVGLTVQHGSVVSLAASSYYGHDQGLVATQQHGGHGQHGSGAGGGNGGSGNGSHSPGKYQENGHDTFSDFVTLVCQEAQNTQNAQVWGPIAQREKKPILPFCHFSDWLRNASRFKRDHRVAPWSFRLPLTTPPACYRHLRHR